MMKLWLTKYKNMLVTMTKSNKGYNELDQKKNAWWRVEADLGLESGTAENKFYLLKEWYSQQKNDLKKSIASGACRSNVTKPRKLFDEYTFLSWLEPHIRFRKTTANLTSTSFGNEDNDDLNTEEAPNITCDESESSDASPT